MEPVIPEPAQVEMLFLSNSKRNCRPLLLHLWSEGSDGILSAFGSLVALHIRIGVFAVTLPFRIGVMVGGLFIR